MSQMNGFELVIFDCDGVLVDSERLANQIFAQVLAEQCDLHFSLEEMFETFVWNSSSQCMEIIAHKLGRKPPDGLEAQYKLAINQALANSVEPVQGIEQALAELPLPYCVASSGSYEKMNTTLGCTGLSKYFEGKLTSTSDVANGKPAPDIYHFAAHKMGVKDPSKCLVVEDSPLGIQGAVAAGMSVFGYAELVSPVKQLAAGAHHTFDDMAKLAIEIQQFAR